MPNFRLMYLTAHCWSVKFTVLTQGGVETMNREKGGNVMKTIPSIETQQRMHAFFMKTSAPRIYKELLEAEQKRKEIEAQEKLNKDQE